jgi:hypothetical protein
MQSTLHGCDADLKNLGHLGRAEPFDVTQEQHLSVHGFKLCNRFLQRLAELTLFNLVLWGRC